MHTFRPAITLSETLIVSALLAVLLIVVALGTVKVRSNLKHEQVRQLLTLLDEALTAYHQATGDWPVKSTETDKSPDKQPEYGPEPADHVIELLSTQKTCIKILEKIPPVLWVDDDQSEPAGLRTVQDAWGRRLGCLTAYSPSPIDQQAVAANGGKPIFISAGADGKFGTKEIVAAADNLRSDELDQ